MSNGDKGWLALAHIGVFAFVLASTSQAIELYIAQEDRDTNPSTKSVPFATYPAEAGHRLSTTLHLGHLAIRTGRTIRWDAEREAFPEEDTDSSQSIIYRRPARGWVAV